MPDDDDLRSRLERASLLATAIPTDSTEDVLANHEFTPDDEQRLSELFSDPTRTILDLVNEDRGDY